MKKTIYLILFSLAILSCGPKQVKTESGKFMPFKDGYGFVLPISPSQGSEQNEYSIVVTFEEDAVYLKSKRELSDPFLSIMYKSDMAESGHETTQVSLDFRTIQNGQYIYSTNYKWFIPKETTKKVIMAGFYYAPTDVAIKTVEKTGPNGQTISYPDFTGYEFVFGEKEFPKYFKEFINHLD